MDIRDYEALAARVRAAARPPHSWRVYGRQSTLDGAERYDLLIVRVPAARAAPALAGTATARRQVVRSAWRVLLNGGTHGDEPAGAEAVTRFLEQRRYERWPFVEFTVLPCTNPWGYVHNRREGPGGADLNRSFRRAGNATPEVTLLKRALGRRSFDLFLDCHEDVDAPGLYVYAPMALGRVIVAAARRHGPIHPGPLVDERMPLDDGVVVFEAERTRQPRRAWTTWPLPLYIARYRNRADRRSQPSGSPGERVPASAAMDLVAAAAAGPAPERASPPDIWRMPSATIETPTCIPLDQRVAMHLAALDAALATLSAK